MYLVIIKKKGDVYGMIREDKGWYRFIERVIKMMLEDVYKE